MREEAQAGQSEETVPWLEEQGLQEGDSIRTGNAAGGTSEGGLESPLGLDNEELSAVTLCCHLLWFLESESDCSGHRHKWEVMQLKGLDEMGCAAIESYVAGAKDVLS